MKIFVQISKMTSTYLVQAILMYTQKTKKNQLHTILKTIWSNRNQHFFQIIDTETPIYQCHSSVVTIKMLGTDLNYSITIH